MRVLDRSQAPQFRAPYGRFRIHDQSRHHLRRVRPQHAALLLIHRESFRLGDVPNARHQITDARSKRFIT